MRGTILHDTGGEAKDTLEKVGAVMRELFPEMGYCVIVWKPEPGGNIQYVSNMKREYTIGVVAEFLAYARGSFPHAAPKTTQ